MSATLRERCINNVARELARPMVESDSGWQEWPRLTKLAIPEAEAKINAMSNLELLDLMWEVLDNER